MIVPQEGVGFRRIDTLTRGFGFPVGLVTLLDEIGIDVAFHVQKTVRKISSSRLDGGTEKVLISMLEKGFKGTRAWQSYED